MPSDCRPRPFRLGACTFQASGKGATSDSTGGQAPQVVDLDMFTRPPFDGPCVDDHFDRAWSVATRTEARIRNDVAPVALVSAPA